MPHRYENPPNIAMSTLLVRVTSIGRTSRGVLYLYYMHGRRASEGRHGVASGRRRPTRGRKGDKKTSKVVASRREQNSLTLIASRRRLLLRAVLGAVVAFVSRPLRPLYERADPFATEQETPPLERGR